MKTKFYKSIEIKEMQDFINQNNFDFVEIKQIFIPSENWKIYDFYYLLIYKKWDEN